MGAEIYEIEGESRAIESPSYFNSLPFDLSWTFAMARGLGSDQAN